MLQTFFSKFSLVLILGVLVYIYRPIFLQPITSAGDFPFYWDIYINELSFPSLWNPHWPTGLGGNQAVVLPLKLYFHSFIVVFVQQLHVPWEVIERIVFFLVFFIFTIYTSYLLTKSWIGSLIYTANTWILMVVSGGQMGIALAYAFAPLSLHLFIKLIDFIVQKKTQSSLLYSIFASIAISTVILFDLRVGYIVIIAIFLYFIFTIFSFRSKNIFIYALIIPISATFLLNCYWMIPLLFSGTSLSAFQVQPTLEQVKFFSFATYSNTVGMLHPNWPENIFGKVGFMKPEFLVLPLLANASLLFVDAKKLKNADQTVKRQRILFFTSLGLLGIFLAKGANEPFGEIYIWLFENVPGFNMFRDSTKFYILIAVSYSFLIPITLASTSASIQALLKLKKRKESKFVKKYMYSLLLIIFICYYAFLMYPALSGQLSGIFKEHAVPNEYVHLKNYLAEQNHFYRTLWIPQRQRYGYYSNIHPALNPSDFLEVKNIQDLIGRLKKPEMKSKLQAMAVKYVILPFDSEGEIFLNDRKYDEKMYQRLYRDLKSINWMNEEKRFGKNVVFSVSDSKDHIWMKGSNSNVSYNRFSDTSYDVTIKENKKGDTLIFSERFDSGWVLKLGQTEVKSVPYDKTLNSYTLPFTISKAKLEYKPQRYLEYGYLISGVTLFALILGMVFIKIKKK